MHTSSNNMIFYLRSNSWTKINSYQHVNGWDKYYEIFTSKLHKTMVTLVFDSDLQWYRWGARKEISHYHKCFIKQSILVTGGAISNELKLLMQRKAFRNLAFSPWRDGIESRRWAKLSLIWSLLFLSKALWWALLSAYKIKWNIV